MISIIIPAHNEAMVIARTLRALTTGASFDELDVLVVCNGCTDDTANVARGFGLPVRVIETPLGNKANALNLGDQAALAFPRIYVDADVIVTLATIRALADHLQRGDALAVAPSPYFDLAGCSWAVRAFYDIRCRLPSAHEGIGGSGVYALSEIGRRRFDNFPNLIADDTYVRIQFKPEER
jgi:glycosyltransferase involved in cell wall biosynthesis